jgi:hypothetical protein
MLYNLEEGNMEEKTMCPICRKHELESGCYYCDHCSQELQRSMLPIVYVDNDNQPTGEVVLLSIHGMFNGTFGIEDDPNYRGTGSKRLRAVVEKGLRDRYMLCHQSWIWNSILGVLFPFYYVERKRKKTADKTPITDL